MKEICNANPVVTETEDPTVYCNIESNVKGRSIYVANLLHERAGT